MRARYGAIAEQQVPARLELDRLMRARAARGRAGGGGGGRWHSSSAASPAGWRAALRPRRRSAFELFTAEALGAHRLYIAEVRHPIEVTAGEQHLVPWLSRRVGTTLRTPDLASFSLKLLGGRLLPGPNGPAALFMYEGPTGERYTFYCSKLPGPRTAFRYNAPTASQPCIGSRARSASW